MRRRRRRGLEFTPRQAKTLRQAQGDNVLGRGDMVDVIRLSPCQAHVDNVLNGGDMVDVDTSLPMSGSG